ncbi:3-phenylpropionate/cinnamic acid dioxygenase ferredoxin subunit [Azospirillum sp. TSO35-2]|uniref:3-phenylpropionate/cinnamic acid dioxygenase ferredoxin subunit n=1 Tax=Azospirillum sp. TSO35-2 TaxID=716796 RepID=UPI000D617852|nr:3-phenylpropionate/cinnamic acid dioxygenase ferredoxin subunit [Azospirillum sp. TSO35-2]PWC37663.1 3-phenylpropionate dioxygenase [Azospirillum sp. TSO35-2]
MTKIRVCSVDDLQPGDARRVECSPAVAVFNADGNFYAVADLCTHGNASMADGYLEDGAMVECPLHTARFCLKTGRAMCLPATEPLRTFPVSVEDGDLFIEVDDPDAEAARTVAGSGVPA